MQIIRSILHPYDRLLGKQKINVQIQYRLMTFVIQLPISEGTLFYHTMTKSLVLLTNHETCLFVNNPLSVPELIALWFAVPIDYDDHLLSRQFTHIAKMLEEPIKGITNYTIFTTTDCNARCFYCFEKGRSRIPMSEETARKTAKYIIKHCLGQRVSLSWFGGEPLYNKSVIDTICSILRDAGIVYKSTMISNAYLMDSDTIQKACSLWNLKSILITLDGTEKVYNRCKAYIYREGSAFLRVIDNIRSLLEAGIKVSIRLNIDLHNADDLFLLAEQLRNEFSSFTDVSVFSYPLYGNCMEKAAVNNDIQRRYIFEKQKQLSTLLQKYGLAKPKELPMTQKSNNCMADNDRCITILPDGHIGKCNQFSDDNFIGHIDQEEFDQQLIHDFKTLRKDELEVCNHCVSYPDCFYLNKCPHHQQCYPENRERLLINIRQGMQSAYQEYKLKKS